MIDMGLRISYLTWVALSCLPTQLPIVGKRQMPINPREQFETLLVKLHANTTHKMTQREFEKLLPTEQLELMRRCLQGHLDERSVGLVIDPVIDTNWQTHSHLRMHTRKIESVFGTVTPTSAGFGGHGLESLHPLDAALNLPPEQHSHSVRQLIAEAAAKESFDEVVTTLGSYTGAQ